MLRKPEMSCRVGLWLVCVFTLTYLFYVFSSLAPEKVRGFHLSPKSPTLKVKQIIAHCLLLEKTYMLDFHLPLIERLEMKMSFLFLSKKCIEWCFFLKYNMNCSFSKECSSARILKSAEELVLPRLPFQVSLSDLI